MNQASDQQTFELIRTMSNRTNPDLIVITGDMFMSEENALLARKLSKFMDNIHKPWTFVFGNHDAEHGASKEELSQILMESNLCLFENGSSSLPGVGNYCLEVSNSTNPWQLCFLDSGVDRMDWIDGEHRWGYQTILPEQIEMVSRSVMESPNRSTVIFFHIPIPQVSKFSKEEVQGEWHENVCCANVDFGFFDSMVEIEAVKGMFFGHDHVNDFSIEKDGILLAYGRCSGHYNYTMPEFVKGVRIIDLTPNGKIETFVLLEEASL